MAKPILIDTDPGVDDALALLLALASPELSIQAITIVGGNVGLEPCVRNALLTLEISGVPSPPPVAVGAAKPLVRDAVRADGVHGSDGLGGASKLYPKPTLAVECADAVKTITKTAERWPGELTLVALGPLTNVAAALAAAPETMKHVREIIAMGGSMSAGGNATPAAEFNFWADPHAAAAVVGSGLPVTLVGLDVTHQVFLTQRELERRVAESTRPAAHFALEAARYYMAHAERYRDQPGCYLHDPLAVGVALDPTLVETETFPVAVETDGSLTAGAVVADRRPWVEADGPVRIARRVDVDRFRSLFLDRLCAL